MTDNAFRQFHEAGYRRLVPVVPPDARVSERSSLFKRREALGKAPGVKGPDGLWRGVDWLKLEPTEADLDAWHGMGAGVGLRTGDGLVCLDIDTLEKDLGDICGTTATKILGASVNRVGQAPKRAKFYRVSEPVAYQRLKFDGGHVELLSDGRQVVVKGIHPKTGQPYTWRDGVPKFDRLPMVSPAQIAQYFAAIAKALPKATLEASELPTERATVDQGQLTGSLVAVRRAVAALPNTTALFPSYDDYVRVGYAIKGATQDDPERGLELFQTWSAKWAGGNEPDRVAADWARMKPPFSVGAQYLYHLAEKHGDFSTADTWFEPIVGHKIDLNVFETTTRAEAERPPMEFFNPAEKWKGLEPPQREWEVRDWIPRYEVTLLYGEGGVGKTLLAHQYAICAAAGRSWLGQQTRRARVMCFFCEDNVDELHRRHRAIMDEIGAKDDELGDRLRMISRTGEVNTLATWPRGGPMQLTDIYRDLKRQVDAWKPDVLVLDTLADIFGGSEIDRGQVNSFVKSAILRLVQDHGGTALVLGHPSVGGRTEGRSGSTAWSNAARSRLYLTYANPKKPGVERNLEGMKINARGPGGRIRLHWRNWHFATKAVTKASADGDTSVFPTIEDIDERAVFLALAAAEDECLPLNLSPHSSTYAPKILKRTYPETVGAIKIDDVHAAIVALMKRGDIRQTMMTTADHYNRVAGFTVTRAATGVFR